MAGKNEIKHRLSLEGDDEVKAKLKAVGEAGKQSLDGIEKNLHHAGSKFGELGKEAGEAGEKLGKVFEPFLEQAGLTGLVSGTGGFFGRLIGVLRSPTGIAGVVGAGLATLAEHLAEVSKEGEKAQSRLQGLGGGKKAFEDLNESASKAGVSSKALAAGTEKYLQARGRAQANSAIQYAPGFEPQDGFTANVLGGPQRNDVGTKSDFDAARKTLIDGSKQDKLGSKDAIAAIDKLNDSLYANGHLTGKAVRDFQQDAPNDANRLARAFGRGDAYKFAKFLDEEKTPSISAGDVFRKLKQDAPNAAKDAEKNRNSTDASERLQAKLGGLDEALAKVIGKPVDKLQTKAIDKLADGVEAATKNFEHNSEAVKEAAHNLLHNDVTDFLKKAFTDPGALKEPEKPKGETPKGDLSKADGGFGASAAAKAMQENAQKSDAAHVKAAGDHTKAATDLSKAATDLSKAASEVSEAGKDSKKAQEEKTQAQTTATRNSANDEAGVTRPVGSRGIVEDLTSHSGDHPDTQVSGDGSRAEDIADLNKMLNDQKSVGEYEGDKHNEFTKSIRDQLGLKTEEPKGERLYPGGPARYRQPDSSREPAELGTYDDNMNFVPNKRQPYGRLREKPYLSDRPYNKREDTYDTKGGGDANPIYNFGQPQPLDFPAYTKSLRDTLPGVPLPRPDPRTPGPQSELQPPAQPPAQPQPQPVQPAALQPAAFQQGPLPPQPPALVETIAGAITNLLNSLHDRMVGPENNVIGGPTDAVGVRGDAGPLDNGGAPQNVAALDGAAVEAAEGLRQVASAAPAAAGNLTKSGGGEGETTTVAASGGYIEPARFSVGGYTGRQSLASRVASASRSAVKRFAGGGEVSGGAPGAKNDHLSPGSHSITATGDGGAIIDGVFYPPGSPILQDELVQSEIKRSLAGAGADKGSKHERYHSPFVGRFGHDDSNGAEDTYVARGGFLAGMHDVRRYDGGGAVRGPGTTTSDDIDAKLSHGEFVVNARDTARSLPFLKSLNQGDSLEHAISKMARGGKIEVPGFADGGSVGQVPGVTAPGLAPSAGDISSSPMEAGHHAIDMRTNFGDYRVLAPEHIARSMSAAARDSSNAQTGQRPSWYRGR